MSISLVPAEHYQYVENLFQYYLYDMSEYMGWPPDKDGTYKIDKSLTNLAEYWSKPEHYPYLIMVDNEVAGFSLIRRYPGSTDTFDIGQFFVLRKFKGAGVGRSAFNMTVAMQPGKWVTRVLAGNQGAYTFWEKVISEVAVEEPTVKRELYRATDMHFFYYEVRPC